MFEDDLHAMDDVDARVEQCRATMLNRLADVVAARTEQRRAIMLNYLADALDLSETSRLDLRLAEDEGSEQNLKETAKWRRQVAEERGNNFGVLYVSWEGAERRNWWNWWNWEEAAKWLRRAAEAGNSGAMTNLALCYAKGEGVAQSFEEAVKWLRQAAEAGDSTAMISLGLRYADGSGVEQSWEEAVKWFRRAAAEGDEEAIASLKRLGEEL